MKSFHVKTLGIIGLNVVYLSLIVVCDLVGIIRPTCRRSYIMWAYRPLGYSCWRHLQH